MAVAKMFRRNEREKRGVQPEIKSNPTRAPRKKNPSPGRNTANGGSGAQPQYSPPERQVTQDGAHTVSGYQHQPKRAWWNQRP